MMAELGSASALVLVAVFAWAGIAKLRHPRRTIQSFDALAIPAARPLAVIVPLAELALAATLVVAPRWAAWAAVVLLVVFTGVLARTMARGIAAPCSCFGNARNEPVSSTDIVRNGFLGALAIVATGATHSLASSLPSLPAIVIMTVLAAMGRVLLAALDLRRTTGRVFPAAPPNGSHA